MMAVHFASGIIVMLFRMYTAMYLAALPTAKIEISQGLHQLDACCEKI